MNNVSLIGRLTKDPELRNISDGVSVCNFTLAVDRRFKKEGQPTADFIDIVVWNKAAEFATKWFSKGIRIGVIGRIQNRSWEDDGGVRHYRTEVVAESLYFADGKKDGVDLESEDDDDLPF